MQDQKMQDLKMEGHLWMRRTVEVRYNEQTRKATVACVTPLSNSLEQHIVWTSRAARLWRAECSKTAKTILVRNTDSYTARTLARLKRRQHAYKSLDRSTSVSQSEKFRDFLYAMEGSSAVLLTRFRNDAVSCMNMSDIYRSACEDQRWRDVPQVLDINKFDLIWFDLKCYVQHCEGSAKLKNGTFSHGVSDDSAADTVADTGNAAPAAALSDTSWCGSSAMRAFALLCHVWRHCCVHC